MTSFYITIKLQIESLILLLKELEKQTINGAKYNDALIKNINDYYTLILNTLKQYYGGSKIK